MSFGETLSDFSITKAEFEVGLQWLDLTPKDIDTIVAPTNRFRDLLKKFSKFTSGTHPSMTIRSRYRDAAEPDLAYLRAAYHLDNIAGTGSEIERLCNLMQWVHNLATHTTNPVVPRGLDALQLLTRIKNEGIRINCGMFATILHEAYLSMGWQSRIIHLKPYQPDYIESHVANAVFSYLLKKWLFFDPNLNTYFMDERGEILSIPEIRQRLVDNSEFIVADSLTFNSDNKVFSALGKHCGKDFYMFYISKNIFRYECSQFSSVDQNLNSERSASVELLPRGYELEPPTQQTQREASNQTIYTTNLDDFWAHPEFVPKERS